MVRMQFYDITHQQVEHVIEALNRVAHSAVPPGFRAVLLLQSAQLDATARSFTAAVQQIDGDLDAIKRHMDAMVAEGATSPNPRPNTARPFSIN